MAMRRVFRRSWPGTVFKAVVLFFIYMIVFALTVGAVFVYCAPCSCKMRSLNKESPMSRLVLALGVCLMAAFAVAADRMAPPAGAEVYFIAPQNGAKLHSPVT